MKDTSYEYKRKGLRRQTDLDRKAGLRSPVSRAKRLENVDWSQLTLKASVDLGDGDEGVMRFMWGASRWGDGDTWSA